MISAYLNGAELSFAYDSANRLISAGQNSYTYNIEDVRVRNLCGEREAPAWPVLLASFCFLGVVVCFSASCMLWESSSPTRVAWIGGSSAVRVRGGVQAFLPFRRRRDGGASRSHDAAGMPRSSRGAHRSFVCRGSGELYRTWFLHFPAYSAVITGLPSGPSSGVSPAP